MAAAIVLEEGVEGVTMEGIASRAGVNKALPYRHFANRDDLLLALFDREAERFDEEVAQALDGACGLEAKLRAVVGVWLDQVEDGRYGVSEALELVRTSSGVLEERRRARLCEAVAFFADDLVAEHGLTPGDAQLVATVMLTRATGFLALWRETPRRRRPALTARFVTVCLATISSLVPDARR
jgi:AcrR family transcriptional regulator